MMNRFDLEESFKQMLKIQPKSYSMKIPGGLEYFIWNYLMLKAKMTTR